MAFGGRVTVGRLVLKGTLSSLCTVARILLFCPHASVMLVLCNPAYHVMHSPRFGRLKPSIILRMAQLAQ